MLSQILYKALVGGLSAILVLVVWYILSFLKNKIKQNLASTSSKLKLPHFKHSRKTIAAIVIICISVVALPEVAIRYCYSVLNTKPKIGLLEQYEKMPYNFFDEVKKDYPPSPFKNKFEMLNHIYYSNRYEEISLPRYFSDYLEDNWKAKGYVQKTTYFLDKPLPAGALIGFIEIEFNENYTINDASPVILYLDAHKIYNFPYYFYAPKNIVYLVDSKGNVYKISGKLKAKLYEIQKCRQNAKEMIDILWKYSLF